MTNHLTLITFDDVDDDGDWIPATQVFKGIAAWLVLWSAISVALALAVLVWGWPLWLLFVAGFCANDALAYVREAVDLYAAIKRALEAREAAA